MSREHAPEFFVDADGKHRWRVWAQNARIIGAADRGYDTVEGAVADLVHVGEALTGGAPRFLQEDYRDAKGEHRWRVWEGTGIVASSSEGYKNKVDCLNNREQLRAAISRWQALGCPV